MKEVRVHLRVTVAEREAWQAAAKREGITLSAWLRRLATLAAKLKR
jgi:uncharacterized protein (DUF1778 family)